MAWTVLVTGSDGTQSVNGYYRSLERAKARADHERDEENGVAANEMIIEA